MQPPPVLVTSRQVQNAHTGLDLTVPQHQEVRGKMMSGHVEYQILVVTRLAVFKLAKHRPEDVVQFLVSKKYSEIEEFYQKLSSRYPTASLPPLPRKVLFVGESDIRERRTAFNEILRCISKDAELAGSPELLEFLGTRSPGAGDLSSRDVSVLDTDSQAGDDEEAFDFFQQQERAERPPTPGQKGEDASKSSEEEEGEALDPLGIMRDSDTASRTCPWASDSIGPGWGRLQLACPEGHGLSLRKTRDGGVGLPGTAPATESLLSITAIKLHHMEPVIPPPPVLYLVPLVGCFERQEQDPLKLFDDPDLGGAVPLGDPLLLPAARESEGPLSRLGRRMASEELFRVEEDLDQILNLGAETKPQPQPKPKPPVAAKPALPRKPAVPPRVGPSKAVAEQQKQQQQIQAMDEMDILRYIQDHDTPGQAAPSLF
ncbi:HCLS1-binding protein 3 [Pteropus vampyrus]|uniref:HCLS1-binding protein 3 n=1 Tax=Pteropus vampyrus TaxID=132908 RepID=A0A6P3Q6E3_PTEVA|nr:HCLS1-binding protein 3 [Pteropus vampyrus]